VSKIGKLIFNVKLKTFLAPHNPTVIPTTELDIVQRQDASTGIPEYSRMICLGEIPLQISVGHIHFHETALDNIPQQCLTLYAQAPGNS
jgi:exodeoxyribonuclease V alpha subunit